MNLGHYLVTMLALPLKLSQLASFLLDFIELDLGSAGRRESRRTRGRLQLRSFESI